MFLITFLSFVSLLHVIQGLSIDDENVILTLYTKNANAVNLTDDNIYNVDTSKPTVYIVHGWRSKPHAKWVMNMTMAYLKRGDYNIITVGWTNYSSTPNYFSSYGKVSTVGEVVANSILMLTGPKETFLEKVHLIGHSLGAQICGFAGQKVYVQAFYRVGRITGLDPAGPGYETPLKRSIQHRLSRDDAQFVDVIHTNGGVLGFKGMLGTVDFYPNGGGPRQPGCGILDEQCSHKRSYKLFTESINSNGFIARQCKSWKYYLEGRCNRKAETVMGQDVSLFAQGKHYLKTNAEYPFARG